MHTRTHDLQSDESHAQRLPRLQPSAASIPQSSGSDSIAPLWHCRPPDLRLTTRSPKLITVICRISSIKATDMPREVLGVRLRQQRQYQLLSIRNGLSKASSNAPRSGMIQCTILSSNCRRFRNTFTYRLIPQHWTSITTLPHIPRYIKHH
jgi:hypothetical protein